MSYLFFTIHKINNNFAILANAMETKGINIIAAVALNGAIGRDNDLIWHISEDLKFFKATTLGHTVVMGRKCWESIGRPLPGRRNIVVSRGEPVLPEGVELAHSVEEALAMAGNDCYVIGGGQIYAAAMPWADTLYITRVFCSPKADVFFPAIEADDWDIESQSETFTENSLEFRFEKYVRR